MGEPERLIRVKPERIVNGSFALVEIPDPKLGPRKMDVETMYNKERLRPNYSNKVGVPIFLTRA